MANGIWLRLSLVSREGSSYNIIYIRCICMYAHKAGPIFMVFVGIKLLSTKIRPTRNEHDSP